MKNIKIEWLKSNGSHISQIYHTGLEYSLVNKLKQQCHDFVYCKDFIQDAIYAYLHGTKASIYSFTYDSSKHPKLDLDRIRILIVNANDKNLSDKIPNVLDFINQFCKRLKLKPTTAVKVENPPKKYEKCGCFRLSGSGTWNNSPVMVSMYTLLIRVGFVHTIGVDCMTTIKKLVDGNLKPYQSNDKTYVSQGLKGIEDILRLGYRKFFYIDTEKNYPKNTDINLMHNQTGIVSFSSGYSKNVVPYWHRKSLSNLKNEKIVAAK